MPIYEFYCPDCHRVFNFLSRAVDTSARPACPKCGRKRLERKASAFAISKGRAEGADDEGELPDIDEDRMERAMAEIAHEADGLGDEDPRKMARMVRKLYDATGLPVGDGLDEAIRRMEAGEDPERIEEQLGSALEDEDPFAGASGGKGVASRLTRTLRRRLRPPAVDDTLYEL